MNARNLLFHLRRRIHWRAGLGRGKGGNCFFSCLALGPIRLVYTPANATSPAPLWHQDLEVTLAGADRLR
jgi:hypothetical protein